LPKNTTQLSHHRLNAGWLIRISLPHFPKLKKKNGSIFEPVSSADNTDLLFLFLAIARNSQLSDY